MIPYKAAVGYRPSLAAAVKRAVRRENAPHGFFVRLFRKTKWTNTNLREGKGKLFRYALIRRGIRGFSLYRLLNIAKLQKF